MKQVVVDEAIDPANPGEWKLFSANEWSRVWELDCGDRLIYKTEYLHTDTMLDDIAAIRSANAGKRWGDGQIIGMAPLNLHYRSGLAEASRQRDWGYQKRFWEDRDHYKLRTFEGKL